MKNHWDILRYFHCIFLQLFHVHVFMLSLSATKSGAGGKAGSLAPQAVTKHPRFGAQFWSDKEMKGQDQMDQMQRAEASHVGCDEWVPKKYGKTSKFHQISWFYDVYVLLWWFVSICPMNMIEHGNIAMVMILYPILRSTHLFVDSFDLQNELREQQMSRRFATKEVSMLSVGQVHESTFITQVKRCYKIGPVLDSSWSHLLYASLMLKWQNAFFGRWFSWPTDR